MKRQDIRALALANGFKLKTQPDGTEDLNPYVYEFAAALTEHVQQQNEYLSALASGQPLYGLEEQIRDLMQRNKALQAEVERLRNTSRHCWYPIACEFVSELEQERDQLKDQLYKYSCEDVDVIRCLKTLAYEHNHSDVPRYKDLAKRTMDKYVERCASVGSALALHDADVIDRIANKLKTEWPHHNGVYFWLIGLEDEIRQQAKEVQS